MTTHTHREEVGLDWKRFPAEGDVRQLFINNGEENNRVPLARHDHAACATESYILVFGGKHKKQLLNDVWLFDVQEKRWTKPHVEGTPPCPRYCHTASIWKNYCVIFGGFDGSAFLDDVHFLDLVHMRWEQKPAPTGKFRIHES